VKFCSAAAGAVVGVERTADGTGVLISGGSDDGGSEPKLGFSGVRKGDLNGFWSVLVASFSRRRLACGVDMLACIVALGPRTPSVMGFGVSRVAVDV
jgi:hypothetical protein